MADNITFVGIDEAGFGPILGPLVVSSVSFSAPHSLLHTSWWHILSKSVADKRKHLAGRLLVTDSKKAYNRTLGIKHLQRTILVCLKNLGKQPAALNELLSVLCPDCLKRLNDYPWYRQTQSHPLSADHKDIEIASKVFADNLSSNKIELLDLKSRCLDVGHYNKMVSAVKNKANVLFTATSILIKQAYDDCEDSRLQIIIDRQGGRIRYRKHLQRMFPDLQLKILRESASSSSYELRSSNKVMKLHFAVRADNHFLPVSLASMASKYLRQLLIACINSYFAGYVRELKPTAGYWTDGLRFINDLKKNAPHVKYNTEQLIRCR